MEFRDLKKQYSILKDRIDPAIRAVCERSDFISGAAVRELEARLASYVGKRHCISCANGTDALSLALMAWGIGEGDAVFVPDFTFFASGETVSFEGATPLFVDVDPVSFNLDAAKLEQRVQQTLQEGVYTPKAVVAVDLFGLPADYEAISKVCDKYGLLLLEDGAQGFGGRIGERLSCSFGDISTTSFFPAKPLGCYGDGGAVFCDDDETAALIRSLAVHGKGSFKYDNVRIGVNSRLDTIQAAVLGVKLDAFCEYELGDLNEAAYEYDRLLSDFCEIPVIPDGYYSSRAQYTIKLKDSEQRDAVQAALKEKGIPTMVYYPKPMHTQKAFDATASASAECPVTDRLCGTVLSLPIHPYITKGDISLVASELKKLIAQ